MKCNLENEVLNLVAPLERVPVTTLQTLVQRQELLDPCTHPDHIKTASKDIKRTLYGPSRDISYTCCRSRTSFGSWV